MHETVVEVEDRYYTNLRTQRIGGGYREVLDVDVAEDVIAKHAARMADDAGCKLIVAITQSGKI